MRQVPFMKSHHFLATTLALTATLGFAAEPTSPRPLTRAQVKQDVLKAKAAGELPPAGDEPNYPAVKNTSPKKSVARKKHGATSNTTAAPAAAM